MGVTSTCSEPALALCFVCGEKFANSISTMFLTKLRVFALGLNDYSNSNRHRNVIDCNMQITKAAKAVEIIAIRLFPQIVQP